MAEIRRLHPEDEKSFRLAPHNVEAEQALLGAILVNNEAFYRVSDFLAPEHFYEPIHREIYEVTAKIIRAGKTATPVTVKTFLPDNLIADVTMPQYLARLASEAISSSLSRKRLTADFCSRNQNPYFLQTGHFTWPLTIDYSKFEKTFTRLSASELRPTQYAPQ